jgi:hypothetical protein
MVFYNLYLFLRNKRTVKKFQIHSKLKWSRVFRDSTLLNNSTFMQMQIITCSVFTFGQSKKLLENAIFSSSRKNTETLEITIFFRYLKRQKPYGSCKNFIKFAFSEHFVQCDLFGFYLVQLLSRLQSPNLSHSNAILTSSLTSSSSFACRSRNFRSSKSNKLSVVHRLFRQNGRNLF